MTTAKEDQTGVVCTATEDTGSKWMWLLKRQQQSFAGIVVAKPGAGGEFGQFIRSEYDRWKKVVEQAGIKPE